MAESERDPQNEIRNMFLACAWLGRDDISAETRRMIEALRTDIADLLDFLSSKLAIRQQMRGWATDAARGYLARTFGGIKVLVPFHLFDDLPSDEVMNELLRLAADIRTEDAVICLSGSSAVYGTLGTVADCDFCEYLNVGLDPDRLRAAAERVAEVDRGDVAALTLRGWSGDGDWEVRRPWPTPVVDDTTVGDVRTMMAHYFADTTFEGALEVTKMMIPLSDVGPDNRSRSFPGQELPIPSGTWVPRVLSEPAEISDYILFLRRQIVAYAEGHPAKAVKRAFSLARILFLDTYADEVIALVRESDLLTEAALHARADWAESLHEEGDAAHGNRYERAVAAVTAMNARRRRPAALEDTLSNPERIRAIRRIPVERNEAVLAFLERFGGFVDINIAAAVH